GLERTLDGQVAWQGAVQRMPGSRHGDALHEHPRVQHPEIVDAPDELMEVGELRRKPHHGPERDNVEVKPPPSGLPGAGQALQRVFDAVVALAMTDEQSEVAAELQQQVQQCRGVWTSVEEVILLGSDRS